MESTLSIDLYNKRPMTIVRGSGALLYDSNGNEYIDCGANYGTSNVGHCNPEVVAAIKSQCEQLIYIPSTYYNDSRAKFMQKLVEITGEPLKKVFLCNSGTEAVEAALKFARGATGRTDIIAMTRGFHGRTLGALSATHNPKYRQSFEPLVPGFAHVSFGNLEALEAKISDNTAAVILEPVLGEGGVILPPQDYLKGVRELCDKHGTVMILDEIQTGFGRTGKMFAYEHYGITPDMICLAKSIAGGLPMGAVVSAEHFCNLPKNAHGSTFGGNPFVCAAGTASIDYIIKHNLAANSGDLGLYFLESLRNLDSPRVREARGLGLMLGLELKTKSAGHLKELMQNGVLALPAGKNVMRFLPPLVITKDQINFVIEKLEQVIKND
ncbi:MAG: aspartate aminotransferase family protein [Thermoplasmata archaeon]|nr:MAG: aspartate aminotransferase family protein [Thermoplasmata archaeon]